MGHRTQLRIIVNSAVTPYDCVLTAVQNHFDTRRECIDTSLDGVEEFLIRMNDGRAGGRRREQMIKAVVEPRRSQDLLVGHSHQTMLQRRSSVPDSHAPRMQLARLTATLPTVTAEAVPPSLVVTLSVEDMVNRCECYTGSREERCTEATWPVRACGANLYIP